jgi:hypothetical protein
MSNLAFQMGTGIMCAVLGEVVLLRLKSWTLNILSVDPMEITEGTELATTNTGKEDFRTLVPLGSLLTTHLVVGIGK